MAVGNSSNKTVKSIARQNGNGNGHATVSQRVYNTMLRGQAIVHLLGFALLLIVSISIALYLSQPLPAMLTNGRLYVVDAPGTDINPGDKVAVRWDIVWLTKCPIKVTPYIVDAAGQVREEKSFITSVPGALGVYPDQGRTIESFGGLPPGRGRYFAGLKPQCWYDVGPLAREYKSEEITFNVGQWTQQLKK